MGSGSHDVSVVPGEMELHTLRCRDLWKDKSLPWIPRRSQPCPVYCPWCTLLGLLWTSEKTNHWVCDNSFHSCGNLLGGQVWGFLENRCQGLGSGQEHRTGHAEAVGPVLSDSRTP